MSSDRSPYRSTFDLGQPLPDPTEEAAATTFAIAITRAIAEEGLTHSAAERACDLFARMLDHAKTINTTTRH